MNQPISAVLITKDAERHLSACLAALTWCDDVVVLDSGSRDRTCDLARAAGATVHHQDWLGFGQQKRRAVSLARHDWILSVDADEILAPGGAAVIRAVALDDPGRCWRLPRVTWVGPRPCRHGAFAGDAPIRLFNRTRADFSAVPVHESVIPAGPAATLGTWLDHHSFADCAELFERMARYARPKAEGYRARSRRAGPALLLARACWSFGRSYVLRGGFRDGAPGLCASLSAAADSVVGLSDAAAEG